MDAEGWQRVELLLNQARELPEEQRSAFLREQCGEDTQLREEVESLLRHQDSTFMATPPHLRGLDQGRLEAEHPLQIGPFKILSVLGKGGMGVVYLAQQETPVRRRVALKLVKRGMDTKQVVARFESERQALALMNHPNIAKVYDAGETESGRPYFVMDYIKGVPITEHCDRFKLSADDRIRLFMQVCDGAHHAHQKGVIHRDIKSTNILVAIEDDRAVARIIDFGVAKAIDRRLTEETVFTEFGQLIGTPEYMSPEQAEMTNQDIDIRTDVYSLGVLLYELLVGAFPFDVRELRRGGYDEIRRRIREEDPPKPSTRLTSLGETLSDVATKRRTSPGSYARELRGDLDWITMKALEKDRTRRYASASELGADVGRHLRSEPVLAGPPSAAYRTGKFVRRHRMGMTAASLVLLALVAGIISTSVAMARAWRAEAQARNEAAVAIQASDFMVDSFKFSDPNKARGRDITAQDILDNGLSKIRELDDQPEIQSRMMETIGQVYRNLGMKQSESVLKQALQITRAAYGDSHAKVAQRAVSLANHYKVKKEYDKALPLFEEAMEISESSQKTEAMTAVCLKSIGDIHYDRGELEPAKAFQQRALVIRERHYPPESSQVIASLTGLGRVLRKMKDYDGAKALLERAQALREIKYEPGAPQLATGNYQLARFFVEVEDFQQARERYESALEIWSNALPPTHRNIGQCSYELAEVLTKLNDLEQAEPLFKTALQINEVNHGKEHRFVAQRLEGYARFLRQAGRPAEAERLIERARSIQP